MKVTNIFDVAYEVMATFASLICMASVLTLLVPQLQCDALKPNVNIRAWKVQCPQLRMSRSTIHYATKFSNFDQPSGFDSSQIDSNIVSFPNFETESSVYTDGTARSIIEHQQESILQKWLQLAFAPATGQAHGDRLIKHANNEKRDLWDLQMWSHLFFVPSLVVSKMRDVNDLFLLTLVTTVLSLYYHWTYEKPGNLAILEGISAKLLFAYGVAQLLVCPMTSLLVIEVALVTMVATVFVFTNFFKQYYDPWHALMHVLPGFWALVVASYHSSLI